jgi:DNA uptake protein ComE-like DNA-binding protein
MINRIVQLRGFVGAGLLGLALASCSGGAAAPTTGVQPTSAAATAPAAESRSTVAAPTEAATTAPAPTDAPATSALATAAPTTGAAQTTMTKLNLNTVTEDQLLSTIPDFSNRMVREFFEYRPYISIQQFRKEIGKYVSADQVAIYEQYVYVPVNVNEADAETLQQLPGVDEAAANELIAARPYGDNQAFLTKLGALVSAESVAQAGPYLAAQ